MVFFWRRQQFHPAHSRLIPVHCGSPLAAPSTFPTPPARLPQKGEVFLTFVPRCRKDSGRHKCALSVSPSHMPPSARPSVILRRRQFAHRLPPRPPTRGLHIARMPFALPPFTGPHDTHHLLQHCLHALHPARRPSDVHSHTLHPLDACTPIDGRYRQILTANITKIM